MTTTKQRWARTCVLSAALIIGGYLAGQVAPWQKAEANRATICESNKILKRFVYLGVKDPYPTDGLDPVNRRIVEEANRRAAQAKDLADRLDTC